MLKACWLYEASRADGKRGLSQFSPHSTIHHLPSHASCFCFPAGVLSSYIMQNDRLKPEVEWYAVCRAMIEKADLLKNTVTCHVLLRLQRSEGRRRRGTTMIWVVAASIFLSVCFRLHTWHSSISRLGLFSNLLRTSILLCNCHDWMRSRLRWWHR